MHREQSGREQRCNVGRVFKALISRCEVNNDFELEPRAKPPTYSLYRIDPIEIEELRKKLKEVLEAIYICRLKHHMECRSCLERTKMGCHVYA